MPTYTLYFKAANPLTGEVFHNGYWEEFGASSQEEAIECAKDIIVSVYDYEDNIYTVEFTSNASANVYEITDEYMQPQAPRLVIVITDIEVLMTDIAHD